MRRTVLIKQRIRHTEHNFNMTPECERDFLTFRTNLEDFVWDVGDIEAQHSVFGHEQPWDARPTETSAHEASQANSEELFSEWRPTIT